MKKILFNFLIFIAQIRLLFIVAIFLMILKVSDFENMDFEILKGWSFVCFFVALFSFAIIFLFLEKWVVKLLININSSADFDLYDKITSTQKYLKAFNENYEQLNTRAKIPLQNDYEMFGKKLIYDRDFYKAYRSVIESRSQFSY